MDGLENLGDYRQKCSKTDTPEGTQIPVSGTKLSTKAGALVSHPQIQVHAS